VQLGGPCRAGPVEAKGEALAPVGADVPGVLLLGPGREEDVLPPHVAPDGNVLRCRLAGDDERHGDPDGSAVGRDRDLVRVDAGLQIGEAHPDRHEVRLPRGRPRKRREANPGRGRGRCPGIHRRDALEDDGSLRNLQQETVRPLGKALRDGGLETPALEFLEAHLPRGQTADRGPQRGRSRHDPSGENGPRSLERDPQGAAGTCGLRRASFRNPGTRHLHGVLQGCRRRVGLASGQGFVVQRHVARPGRCGRCAARGDLPAQDAGTRIRYADLARDLPHGLQLPEIDAPGLRLEGGPRSGLGEVEPHEQRPPAGLGFDPQRLPPGPLGKGSPQHQGVPARREPDLHGMTALRRIVPEGSQRDVDPRREACRFPCEPAPGGLPALRRREGPTDPVPGRVGDLKLAPGGLAGAQVPEVDLAGRKGEGGQRAPRCRRGQRQGEDEQAGGDASRKKRHRRLLQPARHEYCVRAA